MQPWGRGKFWGRIDQSVDRSNAFKLLHIYVCFEPQNIQLSSKIASFSKHCKTLGRCRKPRSTFACRDRTNYSLFDAVGAILCFPPENRKSLQLYKIASQTSIKRQKTQLKLSQRRENLRVFGLSCFFWGDLRGSFEGSGQRAEPKLRSGGAERIEKISLLFFVWNGRRFFVLIHVLLVISRTYCNEDVSRLVIEDTWCSLFHALAAHRPSRPVPVNRVAGRRLFGISRTRCTFAFSVILFHVFEKWSKRDK